VRFPVGVGRNGRNCIIKFRGALWEVVRQKEPLELNFIEFFHFKFAGISSNACLPLSNSFFLILYGTR